ncbi:Uncharacterised protein [Mycobacterium tuberculosis]|nr:Uncharacterised protein [Mycobacterium tuberculosis]CNV32789.1 Uncharacterised protein [Mycobacterium tuberculosis]
MAANLASSAATTAANGSVASKPVTTGSGSQVPV